MNQTDIERALRAFEKVGLSVEVTLEPDGRVRFTPVDAGVDCRQAEVDYSTRIKL